MTKWGFKVEKAPMNEIKSCFFIDFNDATSMSETFKSKRIF